MKKIIISLITLFITSGCYNYHELNNYSIVTGIAIDMNKDNYEVSVLIANSPKESSNNASNSSRIVVYSGIGDSVFTAIKDIGLISTKELYMGNFSVLVLSEEVAKSGISDVIDLFLRESSIKKNFYITISKDCKAKDTLKIITPLSNFPSQSIIDNLISTSKLQGTVSNINFNELLYNLEQKGIDNAINSVIIKGNIKDGEKSDNIEQSSPNTYVKLDTLGLFKDDKLIYWATEDESIGINIIRNKTKEMYIKVNYMDSNLTIETTNMNTEINTSINKKPQIDINITGKAKLVEVNNNIDLENDKTITDIKQLMNKEIIKYVNSGLYAGISNNSDVFGFGNLFYKTYPDYYKKNINLFNNNLDKIEINIKSNLLIETKGASQNSLEVYND